MRLLISNGRLPGHTSERTIGEAAGVFDIFDPAGTYIGQVACTSRRRRGRGTEHGWRPVKQTRAKLTDKVGAVRRLPKFMEEN